jgi:hypothetical protein
LAMARRAWHRLRSPLHWPSRLRAWFRQPGSPPGPSSARYPKNFNLPED